LTDAISLRLFLKSPAQSRFEVEVEVEVEVVMVVLIEQYRLIRWLKSK